MSEAHRNAITASSIDIFRCWPSPVRSLASSPAVIAWAAVNADTLSGTTVRTSLDGRQTRHRLDDRVIDRLSSPGTSITETADRDIKKVRRYFANMAFANSEPVNDPGAKVLHQSVGTFRQSLEQLTTMLGFEVDRDRALIPVDVEKVGGHVAALIG